jgi:hypothetical protein
MIANGTQPQKILVCKREYEWDEGCMSYKREKIGLEEKYLTAQKYIFFTDDFVTNVTEHDLATEKHIEIK